MWERFLIGVAVGENLAALAFLGSAAWMIQEGRRFPDGETPACLVLRVRNCTGQLEVWSRWLLFWQQMREIPLQIIVISLPGEEETKKIIQRLSAFSGSFLWEEEREEQFLSRGEGVSVSVAVEGEKDFLCQRQHLQAALEEICHLWPRSRERHFHV